MRRAMRVERLEALLRARGSATGEQLARELDVSVRTVYRDLDALRERGVPVESEPGPGGGVRIDFRTSTMRVELRSAEVVSLWLAAELARRAEGLPWSRSVGAALDRVLAALPEGRRRELRAMLRRVVVGAPATPSVREGARAPSQDVVDTFEEAFTARRGLGFDYVDREGRATSRVVEPHGLLVQTPVWYVLAWDPARGEPRMFRMDRIARPSIALRTTFTPRQDVIEALRC